VGSDAYNERLSEHRAQTVARHLVENGVSESQLDVRGFGKKNPVADNSTEAGRAKNRRVEIVVE
jgi:OOP family OmpA-OmpF porin